MLLEIDDTKTVGGLQEKFKESFPYLKLEFISKVHSWHSRPLPENLIDEKAIIGDITKKHQQGIVVIRPGQKTGEVEKVFKKIFGLFVQVYYQANGQWIPAIDTDDLTLQQLSGMAQQADLQTNP